MNIYEKNLSGTDEIFNEVKSICESDKLGNKIEIEQNRCAMACQGCGAVFSYFYKKAVASTS